MLKSNKIPATNNNYYYIRTREVRNLFLNSIITLLHIYLCLNYKELDESLTISAVVVVN